MIVLSPVYVKVTYSFKNVEKMNNYIRVAVVTGANKGIGYEVVKGLCKSFKGVVYLTARNTERGNNAVKSLKALGFNATFFQLDVDDVPSVYKFLDHLVAAHTGIDILIHNAAIYFDKDAKQSLAYQAEKTLETNYYSIVKLSHILVPLIRDEGRIINVSSSAGHLSRIPSPELRARFKNPNLTEKQIDELLQEYIKSTKDGSCSSDRWGNCPYAVSKVALCALTVVQQKQIDVQNPNGNVKVNSCHPGSVDTDMTCHKGNLTAADGAKVILYLALENHNFKGQYVWHDNTAVDWYSDTLDKLT